MGSLQRLEHFSVHLGILGAAAVVEPAAGLGTAPGICWERRKSAPFLTTSFRAVVDA